MKNLFDITGKVIVVSGSTGVLAGATAQYLARQGAKIAFLGRHREKLDAALKEASKTNDGCSAYVCDVLDAGSLRRANDAILAKYGKIDVLVNGAGGNMPGAVIPPDKSFFDLDFSQWQQVLNLNLGGTVMSSIVFGRVFEAQKYGAIVNFSSMSATQALTRVLGYSNAKAGVDNFTRWLATEFAKKIGDKIRVNAIAPGFFISEQNRALLTNPDGSLTERGSQVIAKTPFGRFGEAEDIFGTMHFLCSDASAFLTGAIIPVDGGFSCFCGV
ncbi:MAG: SDR family oxidoreductase [Opitutales bacterium]|nr:SDR family oxidoreductase [Opitutales bacterium]